MHILLGWVVVWFGFGLSLSMIHRWIEDSEPLEYLQFGFGASTLAAFMFCSLIAGMWLATH